MRTAPFRPRLPNAASNRFQEGRTGDALIAHKDRRGIARRRADLKRLCLRIGVGGEVCLAACVLLALAPSAPKYEEYQVKAAFVYKFIHFVQWPDEAMQHLEEDAPFGIGILGEDPFGTTLDDMVREKTRDTHPVRIYRAGELSDLSHCFVVFVAKSESSRLDEHLDALKGKPVLTVSEISDFAKKGGIVELYVKDNNVRFRINLEAAHAGSLKLSANLLELAEVIGDKQREERK